MDVTDKNVKTATEIDNQSKPDDELYFSETLFRHKKLRSAMRYYLQGRKYHNALKAMNFAEAHHNGTRKDLITPEFDHQVRIAHFIRTLPDLMFPEETIATVFLHDTPEDYDVGHEEIELKFGEMVSISTELVTKVHRGTKKHMPTYFDEIAGDPIASIVKGGDRVHNLQSMVGVFDEKKQLQYMDEVKRFFLPMLKQARRNFPEQEAAYENLKHMLVSQLQLLEVIHASK